MLNFTNLSGTGTFQADGSAATVTIATGELAKTIYAINGNTSITSPYQVQAGDTVTYRLEYLLPTSTVDDFSLTDYLPLPVFDATTVTTFDGTNATNTTAPAAGVAEFGPGVAGAQPPGFTVPAGTVNYTTIFPNPANDPAISSNASTNTVTFTFPGDLEDPQQRESLVDVLFTVKVLDNPFGDGLFLTNQAKSAEGNTDDYYSTADAIQQIDLTQPNLTMTKGVVSTNDTAGVFSPVTVGPVQFDAPGNIPSTSAPFTGTISSPGLASNAVNSNLSNLCRGLGQVRHRRGEYRPERKRRLQRQDRGYAAHRLHHAHQCNPSESPGIQRGRYRPRLYESQRWRHGPTLSKRHRTD